MNKKLDLNKPLATRDGQSAKFLQRINAPTHPLLFLITRKNGTQEAISYTEDGVWMEGNATGLDLVNVPQTVEVVAYANIYPPPGNVCCHMTKREADERASEGRVACVELRGSYTL